MQKITNRKNQIFKVVRKIRDGRNKEFIFLEGIRLVEEALEMNLKSTEVFVSQMFTENGNNESLLNKISQKNIQISQIPNSIFKSISDTKSSQGIILICKTPETGKNLIQEKISQKEDEIPMILMFHKINNPSNLGAILRTAEATDVAGIIITENSANVFSAKALRSAMGSSLRLPIWKNAKFEEALNWAKMQNLTTTCADVNAQKSYLEIDWKVPRLIVFGSEAHGLNSVERNQIEEEMYVPMKNDVESLNIAVACGVILFEAEREKRE